MNQARANAALPARCDLVVIGSGAGGLSAAVTAAHLGLSVVVIEKEPLFGGTTAWSGGWMWVPRNPLARAAGIVEDLDGPRTYLRHILGDRGDAARIEAFLAHAPDMVQFHLDHSALRFIDGNHIPDFHGGVPGALDGGRSVCAAPFDAAQLGRALMARLRPPRDILSWLGMSIGSDLRHFMRANRSWDAFAYVSRRLLRHALDHLTHGQGRLRMGGNALVAALLASAKAAGVALLHSHAASALLRDERGRVSGVIVQTPDGHAHRVEATRGVVLASGGFAHDDVRKAALFKHAPTGREHPSAAAPGSTGDGLRMAESIGARIDTRMAHAGAWAPVSLLPRSTGTLDAFVHLVDRGKPGLIAVDASGRRFANEAGSYHSVMRGLFDRLGEHSAQPGQPLQAWLICDHRFQRRYGLGHSKPWPFPLAPWLHSGYLQRADSLTALARRCGIDAQGLVAEVAGYNVHARHGHDPAWGRGSSAYERLQGDAEHAGPNPCVAPIEHGPFYALRIVPGSLGTFAGLRADAHARVLDTQGDVVPGLYTAGNDMASLMGGHYPSGGITLGPAMTFGYVLAHHAAGRALPMPMPMPMSDAMPPSTS
ncbi:FAD-dependent oxidoreductase [Sphaerotilus mobilis]|uniref:Succinate dehydrogenase/fumarate reductase flavoprotein subunit n=1 Tax=Sphaerotilus mobilis TaxID=47994 RepID=A0A4Q7LW56_9BURK|nr:FAD-dependent oxidoreductase [Sphaerotilus mobilis]RZS57939.1 succinate dehydrogenase/fumarate reductase flavoprotein subunit [Sphaerotilus mobilis]